MLRNEVVGVDEMVPLLDGRSVPYVNLDNAATTPPMQAVLDELERFLPLAASVHRGSGYKSRLSTAAFEEARTIVGEFLGADPDRDVVVFTKNTTEAINRVARTVPVPDGSPLSRPTKSVIDPSGTGTRRAVPSRRPCMASSTNPVARAAPVEAGMMLMAAPRARRRSLWGPSTSCWSPV